VTTTTVMSWVSLATVAELAAQLRVDSIRASTSAGSGHPTSGMSAADLVAVLVARHLRVDWDDTTSPGNDHLIFSKGHASPLLYSVFKAVEVVSEDELLGGYRRFGQHLQGHPTPVLPWVDVATRIVSYQDWTRELLALGEQALAEARPLPAAYLFGMAEFFLPAEDPRKRTGPAGRSRPRPAPTGAGGPVHDRLAAPDHRPRAAARAQPPTAELAAMLAAARLVPRAWQCVYDLGPIWLVRAVVAACS